MNKCIYSCFIKKLFIFYEKHQQKIIPYLIINQFCQKFIKIIIKLDSNLITFK